MFRVLLVLLGLTTLQPTTAEEWIDFEWATETLGDKVYDKAAILIRVNGNKFLQLDTGSTRSYVYAPAYNFLGQKKLSFKLGEKRSILHEFKVHETAESDEENIGTLGADYFKDSVLAIDFPKKRFVKADDIDNFPEWDKKITWMAANITNYLHITTKIKVGDIEFEPVLFDTGSSIFTLILSKKQWKTIVTEQDSLSPPLKIEVPSWGNIVYAYGAKSIAPICIGAICSSSDVYYIDDFSQALEEQGLVGLMGNAILRENHTLILDYKNKRIGTLENN